jgi:hydrogenase nickel incorporation protein HypB
MNLINLMSDKMSFGVIEGDVYSSIDAEKIEKLGVPVIQINTGGGCHLEANMIKEAADKMKLTDNSILFIENVGNLICPSEFDLGENIRLVISSVAEGDDKPYKYPLAFEKAGMILLNKADLSPYVEFNPDYFMKGVRALNPHAPVFTVSSKTGGGFQEAAQWLNQRL